MPLSASQQNKTAVRWVADIGDADISRAVRTDFGYNIRHIGSPGIDFPGDGIPGDGSPDSCNIDAGNPRIGILKSGRPDSCMPGDDFCDIGNPDDGNPGVKIGRI